MLRLSVNKDHVDGAFTTIVQLFEGDNPLKQVAGPVENWIEDYTRYVYMLGVEHVKRDLELQEAAQDELVVAEAVADSPVEDEDEFKELGR